MEKKFLLGCCYYPEHWDAGEMAADIQKIRDLGFNVIRMGEFSWSMYEKEAGHYDFSFLRQAVSLAQKAGLDVILGTPTAAPPKWLTDRHPEVLCVNANGTVMEYGSRQQHNHTSPVYLRYCAAITEAMVKAFCDCPNVIGWQLDNEFHCHRNESYAESDDLAFRKWLREKYGTIEKLNDAWGTKFWSLELQSFSQAQCPRPTPTHKNPSLMTDYYLFLSDTVVDYAAVQAKIIRKYMPRAFITHNGYFANIDYKKLTDTCLDFLSFDNYPAFHDRWSVGMGRNAAYRLACTRSCSPEFMILEQQSGPGGQLSYLLPTPLPGQIRLWTYHSIAHGAVGILYFRYRTALYGAEQLWYGIYDHDGEENYRSREIRQISEELDRLGQLFLTERRHPAVAIFQNYHNQCCNQAEPFFRDDSRDIFLALNKENIHTDLISTPEALRQYKVVIFPHIAIVDEGLKQAIQDFTAAGGIAILSARTGVKDTNAHYRPLKAPGLFRDMAGCRVDWFTALPSRETQSVQMDGQTYAVDTYYEMLETEGGEVIATYTDGFCSGKPAAVRCGNIYYLGFYCANGAKIYCQLLHRLLGTKAPSSPHLEELVLGRYRIFLNHGDTPVPGEGYDLLSQKQFHEIPPFGVVLTEV